MKRIVNIIFLGIVITVACLSLTQCDQRISTKYLKFATEATYRPFAFMQANGQMAGFSADIVRAVCKQMQRPCKLINTPWDSLIPSLQLGKYDGLFGGMQITPAREKVVDFSIPYYSDIVTFVIDKDNNFSIDKNGLRGKTIGVQIGTTFVQYLQQQYGNSITMKTYASDMAALLDLQEGRVDAVFTDKPVAIAWLKKAKTTKFITKGNIVNPQLFGKGYGIAVKKGNNKLLNTINKALIAIKQNGEYNKIVNKWFNN